MHGAPGTGYDAAMHIADPSRVGPPSQVTTRDELVALLRDQHEELRTALARLPELSGPAREDEFWQARRRLAVHEALESLLVSPASDRYRHTTEPGETVLAAERLDTGDRAFETAAERVLLAHQRHAEQLESVFISLGGELTPAERAVAETAVALWLGEGDTYLGHDYRDMVSSARTQLEAALEPGHGPRP